MHVPLAISTIPAGYEDYRYVLELRLNECAGAAHLAVLMKNPSTASAERLDPTIGKVRAWAQRHGFARVSVVNLFARRATHPAALNAHLYAAIVGSENDRYIREAAASADIVVAGWGNPNGLDPERYTRRITEVLELLMLYPLYVIGAPTKRGHPRHGLMWHRATELALWR
ncbi:MAG TPA: DUF1643 domain-containing protein [Ktedonobacterales bacterium]